MRKLVSRITAVLLISFLFINTVAAGQKTIPNSNLPYDKVEKNLLIGLRSDNFGLKVSSAYMLGEIKSVKAVNELSHMLRTENDDRARLVAALALIKIDSERSVYVVKDGIKFNEYKKVRDMCEHLYNAHLVSTFNGVEPDQQTLFSYVFSNNSK